MRKLIVFCAVAMMSAASYGQHEAERVDLEAANKNMNECVHHCGDMCVLGKEAAANPSCSRPGKECYEKYGVCEKVMGKCKWKTKPELRVCMMTLKSRQKMQ